MLFTKCATEFTENFRFRKLLNVNLPVKIALQAHCGAFQNGCQNLKHLIKPIN